MSNGGLRLRSVLAELAEGKHSNITSVADGIETGTKLSKLTLSVKVIFNEQYLTTCGRGRCEAYKAGSPSGLFGARCGQPGSPARSPGSEGFAPPSPSDRRLARNIT